MIRLAILYENRGRMPLRIAKVENRMLLSAAAVAAVREAEERADELTGLDPMLGRIEREEAQKIRRILGALLPASEMGSDVARESTYRAA